VPVLVVGAGPTGLLLASELHRRGVGCRLIDARPQQLQWDRATVVHPRSLEVFESLGLIEPFLAAGTKQRGARLHSEGSVIGELDLAACGSRYGFNLGISEQVTESILTDHLCRHGGDVDRAAQLVALEDRADGIVAGIERDGVREEVSAQWVVGCDGLHSMTRELGGIELAGHDIPQPWAVFDATLEPWPDPYDVNLVYLDEISVILTALPERRWRVYLRPSSPDSDLVADAVSTIGRYHPAVAFVDVADPRRFHCHTKVATRFRSGRVLLAGDAAHVCSPAQGHGMNSGLQDAFNLAWKLALVCRGHAGPDLLDSYEAERRPVAERITGSGDAAEHAQTLTDAAERLTRDATLRAVFADPTSRHHEVIAEAELDIDYGDSPIVAGEATAAFRPGERLADTIAVGLATGEGGRTGHTAVLIGGTPAGRDGLERLERQATAEADPTLIEATVVLTPDGAGVDEVTLLVVRPDGHIGLVADHDHITALAAYQSLVGSTSS
jgi:2-polyprenyl-6-methoxyphenol hydroxylase-like FAD-dependent oxidoreductase